MSIQVMSDGRRVQNKLPYSAELRKFGGFRGNSLDCSFRMHGSDLILFAMVAEDGTPGRHRNPRVNVAPLVKSSKPFARMASAARRA